MKGDVIIVEDHHRRATAAIVERTPRHLARDRRSTDDLGESSSGKSETGGPSPTRWVRGITAVVFAQDDALRAATQVERCQATRGRRMSRVE
jgi:hypothetical protein